MDALSLLVTNIHLHDTKFYYLVGNGSWAYTLTRPDSIFFYLVVKGAFSIDINGVKRTVHTGDITMISNAVTHCAYAIDANVKNATPIDTLLEGRADKQVAINKGSGDCNAELVLIQCSYDREVTQPLLTALPSMLPEYNPEESVGSKLLDMTVDMLKTESTTNRMGKTAMINRLASIIMIDCLRTYIEALPENAESCLLALRDPYLSKAMAVMHKEPNRQWTISQLAEVAGMSRSSFAERFKQIVGSPPLTYLIDYRMRLAARYLRMQQHSISRISGLVGYASDSTFSQAFKRVYGISPRGYRQRYID